MVDGSGSEVERETHLEGIAEEMEVEEEEEEEEEKEDSSFHPSSSVPDITPDSTVPSEPSESLVTTTHCKCACKEEGSPPIIPLYRSTAQSHTYTHCSIDSITTLTQCKAMLTPSFTLTLSLAHICTLQY